MKKVDLRAANQTLRLLAYGVPGSGKTTFTGTAALDDRTSPVMHVDCSGNPESLLKQTQQGDVFTLDALSELNAIYDWLSKGQPAAHEMVTRVGAQPGYRTLVFDGITAIQRKSFDLVMGAETTKPGNVEVKADWVHYRGVLAQMLRIATLFLHMPKMHVIVTALEKPEKRYVLPGDEKTAYWYIEPALQGQSQIELPGEALTVMRFAHHTQMPPEIAKDFEKTTNGLYCITQLQPSKTVYAKDQHGFNARYLANPTVSALLDRLEKKG